MYLSKPAKKLQQSVWLHQIRKRERFFKLEAEKARVFFCCKHFVTFSMVFHYSKQRHFLNIEKLLVSLTMNIHYRVIERGIFSVSHQLIWANCKRDFKNVAFAYCLLCVPSSIWERSSPLINLTEKRYRLLSLSKHVGYLILLFLAVSFLGTSNI